MAPLASMTMLDGSGADWEFGEVIPDSNVSDSPASSGVRPSASRTASNEKVGGSLPLTVKSRRRHSLAEFA